MKNGIFSIIIIFLLTAVVPEAKSESVTTNSSKDLIHLLLGKSEGGRSVSKRVKKRKLKKAVRKVARVYRNVKPDRQSKKKSRKTQRKARRIINIF
ncbi:MAG: hypothetical protein ACYCZO_16350 [Daejeonella sp.]